MELTDLIVMIIGFVFFVLPSVFRGLGKKKPSPKKKKKRVSLFSKLGEGVQTFLQELEQQAKQSRQKSSAAEKPETFWDEMTEDDSEIDVTQVRPIQNEKKYKTSYGLSDVVPVEKVAKAPMPSVLPETNAAKGRTPLQNAVIWAEILGKPVALKADQESPYAHGQN